MAGIIVLLLGLSGVITKIIRYLPMPIVMGMTAGCLFKFATDIVKFIAEWSMNVSTGDNAVLLGIALAAVVALSGVSFFSIGPAFWALFIGTAVAAVVETEDLKELIRK